MARARRLPRQADRDRKRRAPACRAPRRKRSTAAKMREAAVESRPSPSRTPLDRGAQASNSTRTRKLTTGLNTYRNTQTRNEVAGDVQFGRHARGCARCPTAARTSATGCATRRCSSPTTTTTAAELSERTVRQMDAFNQAHPSPPILWMVIPNKTTTYIEPNHSARLRGRAQQDETRAGPVHLRAREARTTCTRLCISPTTRTCRCTASCGSATCMLKAVREILSSGRRTRRRTNASSHSPQRGYASSRDWKPHA